MSQQSLSGDQRGGSRVMSARGTAPHADSAGEHRPRSPVNQTGEWTLQLEPCPHAHWKSVPQEYGRPAPSKYSAPNAACRNANSPAASLHLATRCPTPCCLASNAFSAGATSTTSWLSQRHCTSHPQCSSETSHSSDLSPELHSQSGDRRRVLAPGPTARTRWG